MMLEIFLHILNLGHLLKMTRTMIYTQRLADVEFCEMAHMLTTDIL